MFSANQIIQYDPLVSDSACHTRAPYLIYLAQKSAENNLNQQEKTYLESCDILSVTKNRQCDVFNIIVGERTDTNKIPEKYLPSVASNKKKQAFLAQKKSEVAKLTLDFLIKNNRDFTFSGSPEAFTFTIPTSKQYIPVMPLYISSKLMLHYAAKQQVPLVVNLKRLILQKNQYQLDGAVCLTYTFDPQSKRFCPEEIKEDKLAIAVDMVNCYVKGKEEDVNGFLTADNFNLFVEAFKNQDLATLIMICAVGHPQYPPSAVAPKLAIAKKPDAINQESKIDPDKFVVKLEECSESEFNSLQQIADRYGFFRKNAQYIKFDPKEKILTRTTSCLFFVNHVYASSVKRCQAETNKLLEKDKLVVDVEEKMIPSLKKE